MSWGSCCNNSYGNEYPVAGYGGYSGKGSNFALIVVLFILLIVVLAALDHKRDC